MNNSKSSSKLGLGVVIGAVVGTVAGLFLAPKAGKELRDDALEYYKKLKDKDPDQIVKEIFGRASEETKEMYDTSKKLLAEQLSSLKQNYDTIDKSKYSVAVKDVVNHIKDEHDLPDNELKALAGHLENDFKKLFPAVTQMTAKLVKKPAKKSTKKVVKKATKKS